MERNINRNPENHRTELLGGMTSYEIIHVAVAALILIVCIVLGIVFSLPVFVISNVATFPALLIVFAGFYRREGCTLLEVIRDKSDRIPIDFVAEQSEAYVEMAKEVAKKLENRE